MLQKYLDYIGTKHGRLTILAITKKPSIKAEFHCICECGNQKFIQIYNFCKYYTAKSKIHLMNIKIIYKRLKPNKFPLIKYPIYQNYTIHHPILLKNSNKKLKNAVGEMH